MGKVQLLKVLFSSEGPTSPLTFGLIFLLDPVFLLFYTLPIKKKIFIK
jgi:hypothetical protein